ncbi:hypothetical protein Q7P37_009886 [Cladosporium fusiforme]
MARKDAAFRFGDRLNLKPQPHNEYIQSQTTSSSGQPEITQRVINRATEAAANEDDEADVPSAGLVREEEVMMDIEGVRPFPGVGFGRPQVLCESCKPLLTASSKRACGTAGEIGDPGFDPGRWRRADDLRPPRLGGRSSRKVKFDTTEPPDAACKPCAAAVATHSGVQVGKETTPALLASPSRDGAVRSSSTYQDFAVYLKNEWPDYWQAHFFNKQDKLEQIRKRPTRKQMFGRPALYSRLRPEAPLAPLVINTTRPLTQYETHSRLAARDDSHSREDLDFDRKPKTCKTLEEFFDLPAFMMPIISNGVLAYRDGIVSRNGRLPRAREVFKP